MLKKILSLLIVAALFVNLTACTSANADNLCNGYNKKYVTGKSADDYFKNALSDFALELFKRTDKNDENKLISPLSVVLALAMTANGADGDTKTQMEAALGGLQIEKLNEYLYSYSKSLKSTKNAKLSIANSIWYNNHSDYKIKDSFIQNNVDYYNAQLYKINFDDSAVAKINKWVKNNTNGFIDEIIDDISSDTLMFLINATAFDGKWADEYKDTQINKGFFININGEQKTVDMMSSTENKYISTENAQGFVKAYKDGYSFVALLPDEEIPFDEFIEDLNGEYWLEMMQNIESCDVSVRIPKFENEYSVTLNDTLIAMGMEKAFFSGGFSGITENVDVFISEVQHKTFISVDENGTKASAVTSVEIKTLGMEMPANGKEVYLNRPFVYAIVDDATGLPIFVGSTVDIN